MTERDRGTRGGKNKKKEKRNVDEGRKKDKEGKRNDCIEGKVRMFMH
jgi:hypothetical protein